MKKILILVYLLAGLVFAQETGSFVEEDAHEHGAAILNIAQEANVVSVEFISPAFNIVGFEYQPSSDEEKAMVKNAMTDLEKGLMLFAPNADAACELVSVSVESEIAEDDHDHHEQHEEGHGEHSHGEEEHLDEDEEHDGEHAEGEHGEEGHDEHAEGEEHGEEGEHHDDEHTEGEEHHDEHSEDEHHEGEDHAEGEDHDHDHEEGDVHSEFHANYEFTCGNAAQLSNFDLKGLFIFYPAIADLDVQYALESGQGAAELNAENSMLNF